MRNIFVLLIGIVFFIVSIQKFLLAAKTSDIALRELAKSYDGIKNFAGQISITIKSQTSKGNIKFKKPNKLLIEFYSPENRKIVSDGKTIWIYLPKENTTIKQPILPKESGFGIYSSEYVNPFNRFLDEYLILSFKEFEDTYVFSMKPKPGVATGFNECKLVTLKKGLILEFSGTTIDKSIFSVKYSYVAVNLQDLSDREFFFSPPADSQVFSNIFD